MGLVNENECKSTAWSWSSIVGYHTDNDTLQYVESPRALPITFYIVIGTFDSLVTFIGIVLKSYIMKLQVRILKYK